MITLYKYYKANKENERLESANARILGTYDNLFRKYRQRQELHDMYRSYFQHMMQSDWCIEKMKAIDSLNSLTRLELFLKDINYELDEQEKTTLLINSIRRNDFEMFKYLMLKHRCRLLIPDLTSKDMKDSYNSSVIIEILKNDNTDGVNPFIKHLVEEYNLNVYKEIFTKNNILYKAILYDNLSVVKYLVETKHLEFKRISNFDYPVMSSKCYKYLISR